ncbi:MAG: citrate transporter [Clostridiales bacterium]|nr:citrate transporter [Clostridiales bacterium]
MKKLSDRILHFIKKEAVLTISGTAAIITMFIAPPNKEYLSHIDFRVLALLFCLMAAVAGFADNGVFLKLSYLLLKKVKTIRSLGVVLVLLCFVSSMWITNDVALITFVPFAIMILNIAGKSKEIIKIVVLQTVAANLGSMLTPVGNPQNLRLYSYYNLSITDFILITLPYAAFSLILILAAVLMTKKERLDIKINTAAGTEAAAKPYMIIVYSLLFLLSLACVIRLIDYKITFVIVLASILILDRKILMRVDYNLLLTFVFFFIFVGNIGSLPAIRDAFGQLLSGREFAVSVVASQVISNVPAAVLLSAFSSNYKTLIIGTNIGGLGTLVASLASLISYKLYCRSENAKPPKYLAVFSLYNMIYLTALCLLYMLMSR